MSLSSSKHPKTPAPIRSARPACNLATIPTIGDGLALRLWVILGENRGYVEVILEGWTIKWKLLLYNRAYIGVILGLYRDNAKYMDTTI